MLCIKKAVYDRLFCFSLIVAFDGWVKGVFEDILCAVLASVTQWQVVYCAMVVALYNYVPMNLPDHEHYSKHP